MLWAQGGTPPDLLWDASERLPGDPAPAEGGSIELHYYDQMAERCDAVRLTLHRAAAPGPEHAPPLELVIKTRWPAAEIDWNGEEVIL